MAATLTAAQTRTLALIAERGTITWDWKRGAGVKGFSVAAVSKLRKLGLVTAVEDDALMVTRYTVA